jgi:hypothetical protein
MMHNHLGRFRIDCDVVDRLVKEGRDEDVAQWAAIFGKVVVIEATQRYDLRSFEYLAYSKYFPALPRHCAAPVYEVEVTRREEILGGQPCVTFDVAFTLRAR